MLKKLAILLSVIICLPVNANPNPAEFLEKLNKKVEKRELGKKICCAADVGFNGGEGFVFGLLVGMSTVGGYTAYALHRMRNLLDQQRALLEASDAQQFGSKSRQKLKEETTLREVVNRTGEVFGSVAGSFILGWLVIDHPNVLLLT